MAQPGQSQQEFPDPISTVSRFTSQQPPWFGGPQGVCAELADPPLLAEKGQRGLESGTGWAAPSPALSMRGKASQETPVEAPVLNKARP